MDPNPEIWGSHFWFTMHTVGFFYPEYPTPTDMHRYKNFYESFVYMLPCVSCREHYGKVINDHPIDPYLESRDSLSRWVVLVHNKVNERIGKKQISYQQAVDEYGKKFILPEKKDKKIRTCVIIFGILLCGFVFAWTTKMHNLTSKSR